MLRSYPSDLARQVREQLVLAKQDPPEEVLLTSLFETLFFASLKREEGRAISCRVAFVDRKRPDPKPPSRVVADRWKYFALAKDLPLNVRNLAKLSHAV